MKRLIAVAVMAGICAPSAAAQVPGRDADPVVLTGAQLPTLAGAVPSDVVAFRWTGSAWDQIPVQVDERAAVPFDQIYNFTDCTPAGPGSGFDCDYSGTAGSTVYTDPDTWTGADPDATLDGNDEVALMAKDAGSAAPTEDPAGVAAGTRTALEITDPISGSTGNFVYLFTSDSLDPAAGAAYVSYDFDLTAGADYKANYAIPDGPNAETSSVETDFYAHDGLTDRWFDTSLEIFTGGATGADILDGDKVQFAPTTCGRSESTFAGYESSKAEGVFIANTNGPVRAIRSYLGANSGPSTQRTHVYYERRSEVTTNLRVHAIPAIMSFLDYSPAAVGMTYRNPANAGLTVDGVPEAAASTPGGPSWEQVSGPQGTLDIVHRFTTDISPFTVSGYYLDDATPTNPGPGHIQCSGDTQALGLSGNFVTSALPTTDPKNTGHKRLAVTRYQFYDAPNQPAAAGQLRDQQITSNLGVKVDGEQAIAPGPPPPPPVTLPAAGTPAQTTPPPAAKKKCPKGKKLKKGKCVKPKKKKKKRKRQR